VGTARRSAYEAAAGGEAEAASCGLRAAAAAALARVWQVPTVQVPTLLMATVERATPTADLQLRGNVTQGAGDSPTLRRRGQSQAPVASDKRGGARLAGHARVVGSAAVSLLARHSALVMARPPGSVPKKSSRNSLGGEAWGEQQPWLRSASACWRAQYCTVRYVLGAVPLLSQLTCAILVPSPTKTQCPSRPPFSTAACVVHCAAIRLVIAASCLHSSIQFTLPPRFPLHLHS